VLASTTWRRTAARPHEADCRYSTRSGAFASSRRSRFDVVLGDEALGPGDEARVPRRSIVAHPPRRGGRSHSCQSAVAEVPKIVTAERRVDSLPLPHRERVGVRVALRPSTSVCPERAPHPPLSPAGRGSVYPSGERDRVPDFGGGTVGDPAHALRRAAAAPIKEPEDGVDGRPGQDWRSGPGQDWRSGPGQDWLRGMRRVKEGLEPAGPA
jgi:hypothetical protein